ncbi:MAG: aldo/keto reductase [Phycisphaerales bacterium]|nr:aldo/keto reductase [Phycisphaerales bacterium]
MIPPLSAIGFGAFKIGRTEGVKYPAGYDLPTDAQAEALLNGVLDLGITYIDTAPAYGVSEERIGRFLASRRDEFTVSTKVGETFEDGRSTYDFSEQAVRASIDRSRRRLGRDVLDLVLVHAPRNDGEILQQTRVVATLMGLRESGVVRHIGFSGHTQAAFTAALDWADAIMVEYHEKDATLGPVMSQAAARGVTVIVKKGLASGTLDARSAARFVFQHPAVRSLVVGSLNLHHLREVIEANRSPETK